MQSSIFKTTCLGALLVILQMTISTAANPIDSIAPLVKRADCKTRADTLGCPGAKLQYNFPGAAPGSNGCGPYATDSLGLAFDQVIDSDWATPCCQNHDLCYGSCEQEWKDCNDNFWKCLDSQCTNKMGDVPLCAQLRDLYTFAIQLQWACDRFLKYTSEQCHCPGPKPSPTSPENPTPPSYETPDPPVNPGPP